MKGKRKNKYLVLIPCLFSLTVVFGWTNPNPSKCSQFTVTNSGVFVAGVNAASDGVCNKNGTNINLACGDNNNYGNCSRRFYVPFNQTVNLSAVSGSGGGSRCSVNVSNDKVVNVNMKGITDWISCKVKRSN
jgi:hypothetical protein